MPAGLSLELGASGCIYRLDNQQHFALEYWCKQLYAQTRLLYEVLMGATAADVQTLQRRQPCRLQALLQVLNNITNPIHNVWLYLS